MKIYEYAIADGIDIRITISSLEIASTRLDQFDLLLQAECAKSNSIADKLLFLETLVRRIEEQTSPVGKQSEVPTATLDAWDHYGRPKGQ